MGDAFLAGSAFAAALALAPLDAATSLLEKLSDANDAAELAGGPADGSDCDWAGDLMIALFRAGAGGVEDPVAEAATSVVVYLRKQERDSGVRTWHAFAIYIYLWIQVTQKTLFLISEIAEMRHHRVSGRNTLVSAQPDVIGIPLS